MYKRDVTYKLPKSKNTLYINVLFIWIALNIISIMPFIRNIHNQPSWNGSILLGLNFIFMSYFWLNGIKDLVYVFFYYQHIGKRDQLEKSITDSKTYHRIINKNKPKVALVYVTCNDFIPESLLKSMNQTYKNISTYILDDSQQNDYIKQIDKFVKKYPSVHLIRRNKHNGFKAGNLNNFLCNNDTWDYFVILDSDEIIPNDMVEKSLPYFIADNKLGILQCNHISTRNHNRFMKRFYRGVDAHWPTYQSEKENYGFLSLLGHGAMISKKCFREVGNFPEMVAEDISFTLEAIFRKWHIRFAKNIICEEQFPIDYQAFVKRQHKWVGGNMQFSSIYTNKIFTSKYLTWYQKLDILLFVYNLPLTYIFSLFLILNIIVMPLFNVVPHYSLYLLIPTILFYFSPMLNDMIYQARYESNLFKQIKYFISSMLLYGSVYFTSISATIMYLIGKKPQFIVTPKNKNKYSFGQILKMNIGNIIFAIILSIISIILHNGLSAVILIVIPAISCLYLSLMSRHDNDWLEQQEDYYV